MLGHDVLAVIPGLRQAAESLMVDTATISRPGGTPVFDPITGGLTPAAGTAIYAGRCRMMQPSRGGQESATQFGEQQVTESRYMAWFPHDTTDARIGDLITFTVSADPDVVDRTFRISAVPASTLTIYKGYPCEVVE